MNSGLASGGRVLIDELKLFLCESSVHGLKYLGQNDRSVIERIFWIISILSAMGVSIYLIQVGVVEPFMANPVIISFYEEEITVDAIPFPAFTVCNSNQFKRTPYLKLLREFDEAVKEMRDNSNPDPDISIPQLERVINLQDTLNYLNNYCDSSESFSEHFAKEKPSGKYIKYVENVNEKSVYNYTYVRNVANKIFHSCEDMIIRCMWKGEPTNCRDLFYPISTEIAQCCVFNMIPMPNQRRNAQQFHNVGDRKINRKILEVWKGWDMDSHLATLRRSVDLDKRDKTKTSLNVPHHQRKAGMSSGLSVLLNPELNEYYSQCKVQESVGFRIQAHSPIDGPNVIQNGKTIQPNSETFVAVSAEISIVHDDIRQIPKEKRQCFFLKERWLSSFNFYTQKNCIDECVMNITFSRCGCVRHYMPRNVNHTICRTIDNRLCVKHVKRNLTKSGLKSTCNECLPACTQVDYTSDSTRLPMRTHSRLWVNSSTGENMKWANGNLSIVHIFMAKETVEAKQRKALYGFQDILANAGGLLGLTLGISMISFAEPFYFFTVRLWFRIKGTNVTSNSTASEGTNVAGIKQRTRVVNKKFSPTQILVRPQQYTGWAVDDKIQGIVK